MYIWRKSGLLHTEHRKEWLFEITPRQSVFHLDLGEVWRYRDLLLLFVKRDIVSFYKQTILGPIWYFLQPLFTSVIFTLVFNNIAGIETGKVPSFLFNLVGVTCWTFFSTCLTTTSDVFKTNANLFGKVYFPRLVLPLSIVLSNLVKFLIQLAVLAFFYLYFALRGKPVYPDITAFCFPLLIFMMGLLGLALGLIISSMVTKYRDLSFLVTFGVQLLMYLSAVNYPVALVDRKLPSLSWLVKLNPMTQIMEASRSMLLGVNDINWEYIGFTIITSVILLFVGILVFNKTEKTFLDTI